jgi:hypothetical protein
VYRYTTVTHGFDAVVAAVSLAAMFPPVPVHARRMLAPVRIFRLLSTSPALREIVAVFARCGEVIAVLLACLLCVCYSYACVGMEAFSSQVTGARIYCQNPLDTDYDDYAPPPPTWAGVASPPPPPPPAAATKLLPCLDPIENFEDPWWGCTRPIHFTHSFGSTWFQPLTLKCDLPVSTLAFSNGSTRNRYAAALASGAVPGDDHQQLERRHVSERLRAGVHLVGLYSLFRSLQAPGFR